MRWLITGGCGFIGRCLITKLINEGVGSIRVVDDLSVGSLAELDSIAEFSRVMARDLPQSEGGYLNINGGEFVLLLREAASHIKDVRDALVRHQSIQLKDLLGAI